MYRNKKDHWNQFRLDFQKLPNEKNYIVNAYSVTRSIDIPRGSKKKLSNEKQRINSTNELELH